jgi:hypothetical protein
MAVYEWLPAPIGLDASRWVTRRGCSNVLVVAHTVVSLHRLLDVVDHVESDPRIQVVFTVAPDAFNHGVHEFVRALGGVVLPWHQATRHRFDLALAAAHGGVHEIHAPLVVMPHGAGYGKRVVPGDRKTPTLAEPPVYGLDAQRLSRDGRVVASALALSHDSQLDVLRRQCPEAVAVAVVVGDPCFDRLVASLPWRERYRSALGVTPDQELLVVSSTWGKHGLFGYYRELLPWIMAQLPPDTFHVAALLHPAVWSAHGRRQVKAWLSECRTLGLTLIEPEMDWRAVIVAADHVIGDNGSVTAYAAAIGRRVLHLPPRLHAVPAPGSPQELVATQAPRLHLTKPLPDQLRSVEPVDGRAVADLITSQPGDAGVVLRRAMYRLLDMPEPDAPVHPIPVPVALDRKHLS